MEYVCWDRLGKEWVGQGIHSDDFRVEKQIRLAAVRWWDTVCTLSAEEAEAERRLRRVAERIGDNRFEMIRDFCGTLPLL